MKIYVASFFDTRSRLSGPVAELNEMGHQVISRWLQERTGAAYNTSSEPYLLGCAVVDIEDIRQAEAFIIDTIDETPRGGREVELGLALARGIPTFLVGPRRNVFHRLVTCQFSDWGQAINFFGQMVR